MGDHDDNDNNHPEETNRRPGKEPMGSRRPPISRTTYSTRSTRLRRSQRGHDQNPESGNEETNTNARGFVPMSEGAYDPTRYVPLVELENCKLRQRLADANQQNAELERGSRSQGNSRKCCTKPT
uniref:Uncharacterized protein n=1 Tax=Cannabis sativa TaxID=3483 RepID=A0A803PBC9_CANSA